MALSLKSVYLLRKWATKRVAQGRLTRFRYRIIARHYRELANREEQADKARMAQHLELLRLKRRKAAE